MLRPFVAGRCGAVLMKAVETSAYGMAALRFGKLLGHEAEIESLLVRVAGHTAKPLCEGLGVAVLAARTDLRAPARGVPGRVGPLDVRIQ